MTNLIRPFPLSPIQTFYIAVEGLGQCVFDNPIDNGDKIFDRIIDASTTHNLKSFIRIGSSIFINFVTQDDEDGKMLDADDVGLLYNWLIYTPPTDQEIIDEFLDEYTTKIK